MFSESIVQPPTYEGFTDVPKVMSFQTVPKIKLVWAGAVGSFRHIDQLLMEIHMAHVSRDKMVSAKQQVSFSSSIACFCCFTCILTAELCVPKYVSV